MTGPASGTIEWIARIPGSLWPKLREEPERAPELIALTAAERFAPDAAEWSRSMSAHHSPKRMARIARRKHANMARATGGALGFGGAFTMAPDLVTLVWIQSRMVFFIAAAYGFDPHDPMRPAELLALRGVYPSPEEARRGLDGVGELMAVSYARGKLSGSERENLLRDLIRRGGAYLVKRGALRLVPGIAAPLNAVENGRETAALGKEAIRYYGK